MTATSTKKVYLLDTSVLIEFAIWVPIHLNSHFWSHLEASLKKKEWVLLDEVVNEVRTMGDLKKWCQDQKKAGLVTPVTTADKNRAVLINNQHQMIDTVTFRSTVDTYLIAHAEANKFSIFTKENYRKNPKDLYRIPDVCDLLKIDGTRDPSVFLEAIGFKN